MKKVLSLVAVAMMALAATFCFSSCSKDDDSKNYETTYQLMVINGDVESTDYQYILKAYDTVFGLSTSDTLQEVTISGTDQSDCNRQFTEKVSAVHKTLQGKTWETRTYVSGYEKNDTTALFSYEYAPAENSSASKSICKAFSSQGWAYSGTPTGISKIDVNFSYIYLSSVQGTLYLNYITGFSVNRASYIVYPATGSQKPITDIVCIHDANPSSSYTIDGRKYTRCGNIVNSSNLHNKKEDKIKPMYLYATTDDMGGYIIDANSLRLLYTDCISTVLYGKMVDENAYNQANKETGKTGKLVQLYYVNNGTISSKSTDCDLNVGLVGYNYFLYFTTFKK